jgi:type VI secretion system secreted protein VgrG
MGVLDELFGTGLTQNARLITLATAQGSNLPESMAVEGFRGREAVNDLFHFDIDALSVSTDLDLDLFLGEELTLKLLLADGSRRAWHGVCTEAAWAGADGGVARYRLRLNPALHLLRARRDSYIFQDRTVQEIVTELLADYAAVRVEFDLTPGQAPAQRVRPLRVQYRETDFDFLQRILAAAGLNWRFEHQQEDATENASTVQARHKLVIFDSQAEAPPMPGNEALRFHGVRAADTSDAIDQFAALRKIAANAVTSSSWHPEQLFAPGFDQTSSLDAGALPTMAVYDGSGERRHADGDGAREHSELVLRAFEQNNKQFAGAGAVRQLAAGHGFELIRHDGYGEGENRFTVLWVSHEARNNFGSRPVRPASGQMEGATYRNRFGCVRASVAMVPAAIAARANVAAMGSQTALVVGLPATKATTGRDYQVKIQFAWQRGAAPNPGGLGHDTDARGNAPGDDTSGAWVRVAEALAGPNWGTQFTPRIGTEVLVDFIAGDIDRPVIVAQLFNGSDQPPWSAGLDSGANHPGVLSGIHSNNFDGRGFNQWQIDDTASQLRTRLASSSAATQLNLGYLIRQAPGSAQRGNYRGSGFELRTDAWAIVRGGDGVLISTAARAGHASGVASTQMDAAEAVGGLKSARELSKALSEAAAQQNAAPGKDGNTAQAEFIKLIDPKEKGSHDGVFKPQPGSREPDGQQPVERFGAPLILMASPSTINWATPASTVLYAGQHLHWTTQADVQVTAAHTVASVAAGATAFFTHAGGVKAFAGNGVLSLQAHTDGLEILADKAIAVISVNDAIDIKAKDKIVIQAGQSAITLEGGDITFACPGKFTVKGGQHLLDKAGRQSANLASLPSGTPTLSHWIALHYLDPETGEGIGGADYEIHLEKGGVLTGTLDDSGNARHDNILNKPVKKIVYKPRPAIREEPAAALEKIATA